MLVTAIMVGRPMMMEMRTMWLVLPLVGVKVVVAVGAMIVVAMGETVVAVVRTLRKGLHRKTLAPFPTAWTIMAMIGLSRSSVMHSSG